MAKTTHEYILKVGADTSGAKAQMQRLANDIAKIQKQRPGADEGFIRQRLERQELVRTGRSAERMRERRDREAMASRELRRMYAPERQQRAMELRDERSQRAASMAEEGSRQQLQTMGDYYRQMEKQSHGGRGYRSEQEMFQRFLKAENLRETRRKLRETQLQQEIAKEAEALGITRRSVAKGGSGGGRGGAAGAAGMDKFRLGTKLIGGGAGRFGALAGQFGGAAAGAAVIGVLTTKYLAATKAAYDLRHEYQQGNITFDEYFDKAITGVPIFGQIASAVGKVRTYWRDMTGETKRAAQSLAAFGIEKKAIDSLQQSAKAAAQTYRELEQSRRKAIRGGVQAGGSGWTQQLADLGNQGDDQFEARSAKLDEMNKAEFDRLQKLRDEAMTQFLGGKISDSQLKNFNTGWDEEYRTRSRANEGAMSKVQNAEIVANVAAQQEVERQRRKQFEDNLTALDDAAADYEERRQQIRDRLFMGEADAQTAADARAWEREKKQIEKQFDERIELARTLIERQQFEEAKARALAAGQAEQEWKRKQNQSQEQDRIRGKRREVDRDPRSLGMSEADRGTVSGQRVAVAEEFLDQRRKLEEIAGSADSSEGEKARANELLASIGERLDESLREVGKITWDATQNMRTVNGQAGLYESLAQMARGSQVREDKAGKQADKMITVLEGIKAAVLGQSSRRVW